jgi:SlyX protein
MTDQIAQLEEKIAHLTRMVEDLSDIVRAQGTTLDAITRRTRALVQREAEREADGGTSVPLADQRPPHW